MAGDPHPGYYLDRTEVLPTYYTDGSGRVGAIIVKTYKPNRLRWR